MAEKKPKHTKKTNHRWDREGCQVTCQAGWVSQANREEPLLARDYPSAPSVDWRHDRGKPRCGKLSETDGSKTASRRERTPLTEGRGTLVMQPKSGQRAERWTDPHRRQEEM